MPTYLLTHDVRASGQLLPLHKAVSADEIVHNDHFAIFRDDDGQPVYTVQRHLLLAIERVDDDQDSCAVAEPDQTPEPDEPQPRYIEVCVDGSAIFDAVRRAQTAYQRRNGRPLDGS